MLTKLFKTLLSLLLLCPLSSVFSQNPANKQDPLQKYTVYICFFDELDQSQRQQHELGIALEFATGMEGEVFKFAAYDRSLSPAIYYDGPPELVFFTQTKAADGSTSRAPIVTCNLGAAGTKILLMKRLAGGKVSCGVLDVDRANFARDSFRIMNVSSQRVRAKVGSVDKVLKPGEANTYKVSDRNERSMVQVTMASTDGEHTKLIINRPMHLREGQRKLMLLYHKPNMPDRVTYSFFNIPEPNADRENTNREQRVVDIDQF